MKIIVCIKQVPDTNDVRWNKDNNLIREGLTSIINPYDEFAIQKAVDIKKNNTDTTVTLLSMGPPEAKSALEYGLAMGADEAMLLCDKRFSGADTSATSKTLSYCIKNIIKNYDYIFCGQFAIDGDTAQTGPSLAQHLNLPVEVYIENILEINKEKICAKAQKENEIITEEIKAPAVICLLKNCTELKNPKIDDYINAQKKQIKIYNLDEIEMSPDDAGIKGSPTFVQKAFRPEINRWCKKVKYNYVKEILSYTKDRK